MSRACVGVAPKCALRRTVRLIWLSLRSPGGAEDIPSNLIQRLVVAAAAARDILPGWAGIFPNEKAPEVGERPFVNVGPPFSDRLVAQFAVALSLPLPSLFARRRARRRGWRGDVREQLGRHVRVRPDHRVILVRGHRDRLPKCGLLAFLRPQFLLALIRKPSHDHGGLDTLRRRQGRAFLNSGPFPDCTFGFPPSDFFSPADQNSADHVMSFLGGGSVSFPAFVGLGTDRDGSCDQEADEGKHPKTLQNG